MDGPDFDKLARKLTNFASRRQALGGLLGAAAAVTGLGAAAEAKKNGGKGKDAKKGDGKGKGKDARKIFGKNRKPTLGKAQCSTGCVTTSTAPGGGGGGGATCNSDADCPVLRSGGIFNPQRASQCISGRCFARCSNNNECGTGGNCVGGFCNCSGFSNQCPALANGTVATCTNNFCSVAGSAAQNPGFPAGVCTAGVYPGGAGGNESACGANGGACTNCNTAFTPGRVCVPNQTRTGGACQSPIACNANQCQLENFCVNELTDGRVCGSRTAGGVTVCRIGCANGQVCTGLGAAASCATDNCTATNCPTGCCQRTNVSGVPIGCNTGNTPEACGTGGAACQNCTNLCGLANNGCRNGQCACTTTTTTTTTTTAAPPACSAASCPNGCCDSAGICRLSTRATCGVGGAACKNCGTRRICSVGVCKRRTRRRR